MFDDADVVVETDLEHDETILDFVMIHDFDDMKIGFDENY